MMRLELDDEQREVLAETLDSFLSDLRMEIADTDRMSFRDMLKRKKAVLTGLLDTLREAE